MEQFFIILQQLFIFTFFVFVGIFCVKFKVFDESALDSMSKFIITITMPVMLVCNLLSGPSFRDLTNSSPIFIVYMFCFIFLYLFNCLIVWVFHFNEQKSNIYKALATFSNAGFIGIPLILAIFGKEGGIFMSLCTIVDQLMLWTLGIKLTSNTNKFKLKNLKNFANPALIAIIFSLIGVIVGIKLPKTLLMTLKPIGDMTPVLSMIYIGGLFCFSNIREYLKKFDIYMLIFFKMLFFPVIIWAILKFVPVSVNIAKTVVLLCSLPSMSSIAIFAKKYDNYPEYAVAAVLITTAFSIITVPLISFLISQV
ncbi:MAG: AEC family transporter [Acutalibacteraceae bacterium]